jgi:hypothetical protein
MRSRSAKVVWAEAAHRIVTENVSPEQAVDEAVARIKQILDEQLRRIGDLG